MDEKSSEKKDIKAKMKKTLSQKVRSLKLLVFSIVAFAFLFSFASSLFAAGGRQLEKKMLIAHRGMSEMCPENTLSAYSAAVENGFSFECDVYMTKDGRIFSFHDPDLKRIAGIDKKCVDCSWDEVKNLDVGSWMDKKWKDERPVTFEQILSLARDGRIIEIDVKMGPEIVPYIKKSLMAQTNATPRNIVFASARTETIKALREELSEFSAWIGVTCRKGWAKHYPPRPVEDAIRIARDSKADGIALQFDSSLITADYIKALKNAGYVVNVWTVDSVEEARKAVSRGADTVTSNRPNKLLEF